MSKETIYEEDLIPTDDEELEVDEVEETELEDKTTDDEELEEDFDEDDEEYFDEDDEEQPLSKSDRAVIKYKKENKLLRQRLKELNSDDIESHFETQEQLRVQELLSAGKSEEVARKQASKEREDSKLEYELNSYKIKGLENRLPGISLYTKELIDLKKKYPDFTYEELYSVKFNKTSAYDEKQRIEALARTNRAEAESKTLEGVTAPKRRRKVNVRPELETAYKIWLKGHPGRSREDFYNLQD